MGLIIAAMMLISMVSGLVILSRSLKFQMDINRQNAESIMDLKNRCAFLEKKAGVEYEHLAPGMYQWHPIG